LYLNVGSVSRPRFEKSLQALPDIRQNGSCVRPADFDRDGDLDIFLGTRAIPSMYGLPCDAFLLENDGNGVFRNISNQMPVLKELGMITDATWFDYNGDGYDDLFILGEWMPLVIIINDGENFRRLDLPEFKFTEGWWNAVAQSDIDHDGDIDFVAGNHGLNSKFNASRESPVSLYINDFDRSGSLEQIYTYQNNKVDYPIPLKQDLARQINFLNKKFQYYSDYAGKNMEEIFDREMMKGASINRAYEFRTIVALNDGKGHFTLRPLPIRAQFSPVMAIETLDVSGDGKQDIVLGGNMFSVKTDVGRYDALYGLVLRSDGKGNFVSLPYTASGLSIKGEIRGIKTIRNKNGKSLLVARNNQTFAYFRVLKK
jgi:hypothetical protein